MISLEKLRIIDPGLVNVSDEELSSVRDELYGMAQLAFENYWAEKGGSNNPVGLFPNSEDGR